MDQVREGLAELTPKVLPFTKPIPFPKKDVVAVGLEVKVTVEPVQEKRKPVPPLDSPQK